MQQESKALVKSNFLIGAKYEAGLNELRLTYAAMYLLQQGQYEEEKGRLVVKMDKRQICSFLEIDSHSIYYELDKIAWKMKKRIIGYSDPESKSFLYMSLMPIVSYDDETGIFVVKFEKELEPYLLDLSGSFTELPKSLMMSFKSAYTFRLYELLKQECFYKKGFKGERSGIFKIQKNLSELRFELGVSNINNDKVREILKKGKYNPDYEAAEAALPDSEKKYIQWQAFKRRCLDVAVNEINEKAFDMDVSYEVLRKGVGGKASAVVFTVVIGSKVREDPVVEEQKDEPTPELTKVQEMELCFAIRDLLPGLSTKDYIAIGQAADGDLAKVKNAVDCLNTAGGKIDNVAGWVIAAIKGEYTKTKKTAKTRSSLANSNERNYDYDALEQQLLTRSMRKDGTTGD